MPFKSRLKSLQGRVVAVVMDDGVVFKGNIKGVEESIIVMDQVEETRVSDIEWMENPEGKCGAHNWCRIDLREVYINMNHASRIWLWPTPEDSEEKKASGKIIYFKEMPKAL